VKRREFIGLLGGAAATWPLVAHAQQQAMPVIGFLGSETAEEYADRTKAFLQGLSELGYVDGRNVKIAYQWAGGSYAMFQDMADEFVRQNVAVLVAGGTTPAARAAKAASASIPIVFYIGGDPVSMGLVGSLNRPGGNATGISGLSVELLSKRMEVLHEMMPAAKKIAVLVNPSNWSSAETDKKSIQETARVLGLEVLIIAASLEREFDAAFLKVRQMQADGLVTASDAYFAVKARELAALAHEQRLPVVSLYRNFADAGGLMSYGGSIAEYFRGVGRYTGRILNGEKPADLPVQQATKIELIINLKTAKALGLTVPLSLLGRADEVIE
jgi:putative ABC transport system substrate-binding protein